MTSKDPAIEQQQQTVVYRQAAACLASAAVQEARRAAVIRQEEGNLLWDALPSTRASQHLLHHHPGWIPKRLLDDSTSKDFQSNNNQMQARKDGAMDDCLFPACPSCGGPLQPGLRGCTLRLVRAPQQSRTQRRRKSRQTARAAEKKKAAPHRKPALSQLGVHVQTHFGGETGAPTQPRSRNLLHLACACGAKTVFPGFPLRKTHRPHCPKKTVKAHHKATDDFLSLSTQQAEKKRTENGSLSSTKKGRMNRASKNQLMDFLSSLIDH